MEDTKEAAERFYNYIVDSVSSGLEAIKRVIERSWEYIVSKRKWVYIGLILTVIIPPIIKYAT